MDFPHPSRVTVTGDHMVTGLLPSLDLVPPFDHVEPELFERTLEFIESQGLTRALKAFLEGYEQGARFPR